MKNKLSIINLALVSACLISGFGCGYLNRSDTNSSNSNNAAANTSIAINKRDPKKFCYLEGFSVGGEYASGPNGYACLSFKNGNLPSGRFQSTSYAAFGDAGTIEKVNLTMVTNVKHKDASEGDDAFAQASGELWQRVFAAPMPGDIRDAILADKGKAAKMEKKFAEPAIGKTERDPGNNGAYTLRLELTLPK